MVLISGKVSGRERDEEDPPIFLDEAVLLEGVPNSGQLALQIEWPIGAELDDDVFARAKEILAAHPGTAPVELILGTDNGVAAPVLRSPNSQGGPQPRHDRGATGDVREGSCPLGAGRGWKERARRTLKRVSHLMITITPVRRALVPIDSAAAARVSAPNYDEFQGDHEIWDLLQDNPMSVLRVTMAHCDADSPDEVCLGDSPDALAKAGANMEELEASELTEELRDVLWVYEIEDPKRPHVRQMGLGGMAGTDEIRTNATPQGTIIRNEGVREPKARGRANLIQATRAIIGMVNNAVDDASGEFQSRLEAHADGAPLDFEVVDQHANVHRVWIVSDTGLSSDSRSSWRRSHTRMWPTGITGARPPPCSDTSIS